MVTLTVNNSIVDESVYIIGCIICNMLVIYSLQFMCMYT